MSAFRSVIKLTGSDVPRYVTELINELGLETPPKASEMVVRIPVPFSNGAVLRVKMAFPFTKPTNETEDMHFTYFDAPVTEDEANTINALLDDISRACGYYSFLDAALISMLLLYLVTQDNLTVVSAGHQETIAIASPTRYPKAIDPDTPTMNIAQFIKLLRFVLNQLPSEYSEQTIGQIVGQKLQESGNTVAVELADTMWGTGRMVEGIAASGKPRLYVSVHSDEVKLNNQVVRCRPQVRKALIYALRVTKKNKKPGEIACFDFRELKNSTGIGEEEKVARLFRDTPFWPVEKEDRVIKKYRGEDRTRHDHKYYLDIDLEHSELNE